jgi:hypothetical protein
MTNHPFNLSVQNPPWCLISRRHLNSRLWVFGGTPLIHQPRFIEPGLTISKFWTHQARLASTGPWFMNISMIWMCKYQWNIHGYWWISMIYWIFMISKLVNIMDIIIFIHEYYPGIGEYPWYLSILHMLHLSCWWAAPGPVPWLPPPASDTLRKSRTQTRRRQRLDQLQSGDVLN